MDARQLRRMRGEQAGVPSAPIKWRDVFASRAPGAEAGAGSTDVESGQSGTFASFRRGDQHTACVLAGNCPLIKTCNSGDPEAHQRRCFTGDGSWDAIDGNLDASLSSASFPHRFQGRALELGGVALSPTRVRTCRGADRASPQPQLPGWTAEERL